MRKIFFFLFAMIIVMLASCTKQQPAQEEQDAASFILSFAPAWNLGNNMDAHRDGMAREDGFDNPPATEAVFATLEKAGVKGVRIPCTWMGWIGEAPDYKVDEARLARVKELVMWAHNHNLKVMINIHHDGFGAEFDPEKRKAYWLDIATAAQDSAVNEQIKAKLYALWFQIASYFKEESADWLMFETMNEIQDGYWGKGAHLTDGGAQYRVLNEWNQVALNAIRAAGGENSRRFVGVPGYVTSPELTCEHLVLPTDCVEGKLLVAAHSYDPWPYAGSGENSEWGHTGTDVAPYCDEAGYVWKLDQLVETFVKQGVPVYYGEFGCVYRGDEKGEAFRKYYIEYVCKAMADRGIVGFWWDNSYEMVGDDAFGLVNHNTGEFIQNGAEVLEIMAKAWGCKDADYTLESIYNRAPQF
ncbi:MAG: glycoside hydrolase family 5 protein [Paludibacteraceae bacterium]|nr:glycoside hydrolase family 5 protein [Paludibacteraceae bacterium]